MRWLDRKARAHVKRDRKRGNVAAGFLKNGDKAEPDWDTYANSLRSQFGQVQDKGFRIALAILVKEPPKTHKRRFAIAAGGLGNNSALNLAP